MQSSRRLAQLGGAILLAVVLAPPWLLSCRGVDQDGQPRVDPGEAQYRAAMKEFYRLEGETLDPGYTDEGFDRVMDMLDKVPFGSAFWKKAQDQIKLIKEAREKARKDKQEVESTIEALGGGAGGLGGRVQQPATVGVAGLKGLQKELYEARLRVKNIRRHLELRRAEIVKYCGEGFLKGGGAKTRKTDLYKCDSRMRYYNELQARLVDEERKLKVLEGRAGR